MVIEVELMFMGIASSNSAFPTSESRGTPDLLVAPIPSLSQPAIGPEKAPRRTQEPVGIDNLNISANRVFPGRFRLEIRAAWPWIIGFLWVSLILWSYYYL